MATSVNPLLSFTAVPAFQFRRSPNDIQLMVGEDGEIPVAFLDQRHPEYESRYEEWLDLTLLYENGSALKTRAERVLKKRPREDEEVYAARLDRFSSQNILGTALGWYGAAMFENDPEIFFNSKTGNNDQGSDFYAKFLDDCDGIGTSFVNFSKQMFQTILIYGSSWSLTDLESLAEGEDPPRTREEERSRGLLNPHLVSYPPINVINWKQTPQGNLIWAVVKTESQEQDDYLSKKQIVTRWYYFNRVEFRVYEDRRTPEEQIRILNEDSGRKAKLIRTGRHCLADKNRVPLKKHTFSNGLWLANRAYLAILDHLNQDNTLGWSLFMSNLAMPVVIGDVDANHMVNSEAGYLQFPTGTQYTWSEPAGTSFSHSATRVESLREECFRLMYLQAQGRSMHATPAMQSGKSKQLEMVPARQILQSMGSDLRDHMTVILEDVRDARRDSGFDPDVRGLTFQEEMTTEEVFAVSSVLNMGIPSEKFEKFMMKRVAKHWMHDANRSELNDVYKEIEAGPTLQEQQDDEFKKRADLAKAGLKSAVRPSPSVGPDLPPGRGGNQPSPPTPESDS